MSRGGRWSRRRLLKAAGVCLTLPVLPSLLPRRSRAADGATQRLVVIGHPNGTTQRGGEVEVPSGLRARLADLEGTFSVVKNINNNGLKQDQYDTGYGTAHTSCFHHFLSGQAHDGPGNERKTFDQILAEDPRHQGIRTPSIAINCYKRPTSDDGIPQHWFNTWAWKGPSDPVPTYHSPRDLFDDLFSDFEPVEDPALRARLERKQRMLDAVLDQIHDLEPRLGNEDRTRLDQYLTGVNELDQETQALLDGGLALQCDASQAPDVEFPGDDVTPPGDLYPDIVRAMYDLVALALQCDATRVVTFMHCSPAGSNVTPMGFLGGFEGSQTGWHPLSHWEAPYGSLSSDVELNLRDFERVVSWHYDRLAEFVTKLQSIASPYGGSLLDETLVSFGSWMGYGRHAADHLYQLVFGSGAGRFRQGVEISANPGNEDGPRNAADLWLTILRGFDVDVPAVGGSSEGLDALLV